MAEKYILFSLDDEKSKKLGEVISNPTCKKIVNSLAEKEMSSSDLAKELSLPLNTIEYNITKLLDAGIIEKAKNFFWSVKGKKIDMYRVANKLIVISPKKSNISSKLSGIIPIIMISALLALFIFWYFSQSVPAFQQDYNLVSEKTVSAPLASSAGAQVQISHDRSIDLLPANVAWGWFLIGCLVTTIAFHIWNWKKL